MGQTFLSATVQPLGAYKSQRPAQVGYRSGPQQRIEQIQSRGDKPAPDLAAAEADVMKLELKTTEDRRVELATANALWKRLTLAQSQAARPARLRNEKVAL